MSRDDRDIDPEVLADLQLRARTVRERGGASRDVPTWQPPVIVTQWPCRVPTCRTLVDVPQEAIDTHAMFSRQLVERGEEPLDTTTIMYCDPCRKVFRATAADRRRGQVDRMAPLIARLKKMNNPESEREIIKQLEAWGHPDTEGLVQAIRNRLDAKAGSTKAGRGER